MKHEIEFYPIDHIYLVDGEEVPSVTTIRNYMSDVEYGEINQSVLQTASRRGSLVHEYTQLIDYDYELDEIEGEVVGYLRAYKDFIRDYKPNWLYIEDPVYSEKYGYVGTMDRFGVIDGTHCVLDIKTVSSPTKMQKFTTSSQTMAYRQAVEKRFFFKVSCFFVPIATEIIVYSPMLYDYHSAIEQKNKSLCDKNI